MSAANVSVIPCLTYRYYGDGVSAITEVMYIPLIFYSYTENALSVLW